MSSSRFPLVALLLLSLSACSGDDSGDPGGASCAQANRPVVVISGSSPMMSGITSLEVMLAFSAPVQGVVANDTVTATGGAATIAKVSGGSSDYTVTIAGLTDGGMYTFRVDPQGKKGGAITTTACDLPLRQAAVVDFSVPAPMK